MVKIYNKRYNDAPAGAVYVGRPTRWGNRYTHIKTKATLAEEVVDSVKESITRYYDDIFVLFEDCNAFDEFVKPLIGKDLVCWCAPKGGINPTGDLSSAICHAQILAFLTEIHSAIKDRASLPPNKRPSQEDFFKSITSI